MKQTDSKEIKEEDSISEFIIDLKFHVPLSEGEVMAWAWSLPIHIIESYIDDTLLFVENYMEILSIKRDWSLKGYDMKFFVECFPQSFNDELKYGFNKTITLPNYKHVINSTVELIGYSSNGKPKTVR